MKDVSRFARLQETATLRGDALEKWLSARIGVIGAGNLGSRFAPEAARSGAAVEIWDFDVVGEENLGTQALAEPGVPKATAAANECNRIRPGSARGHVCDIRHAGIGELNELDLLVDCGDDAGLAWTLTEISNGLGLPLLRLAVDGSGEREMGRVQCSDGGREAACQWCSKSIEDFHRAKPATPCPHRTTGEGQPTFAGGALGMVVAGVGLLQAQRLLGGNAPRQVRNRQVIVDLDSFQLLNLQEVRSNECLSGHLRWELETLELDAARATFAELFEQVERRTNGELESLEVFGHPLWNAERPKPEWTKKEADDAGIMKRTLTELSFPERGAMVLARMQGATKRRRLVLR